MKLIRCTLAVTAALVLTTGCSQEAEAPTNQETADANAMMADPSSIYAPAEMQMMERMQAAQGDEPSETWTRKMIEHHRGAIAMSDILLAQGGDPQVLEKARMTSEMQRKEIAELEALLPAGSSQASAGRENPYAQAVSQMHERMMAATGANPSETWMRKMIEHHRGGAEMSNVLLGVGGDPRVLEKARMTAQKQTQEANELEQMLQGGGVPAPATSNDAPAPTTPAREPQAKAEPEAKTETETPKAPAKTPEAPPADPHAGHDMGNMSNMSH